MSVFAYTSGVRYLSMQYTLTTGIEFRCVPLARVHS